MNTTDTEYGRLQPPFSAATARAHVRELLLARAPDTLPVTIDDVLLVVTELITNAHRHGGGLTAFDACLKDDTITISVTDASPDLPRAVPHSRPLAPGGFGWLLIHRLSRHVAITPVATGKTIEAVIDTGTRTGLAEERRQRGPAGLH
ncbi:ATP-binding protein [Streptomyces rubrogriseus]|uniref:ATP-binding protein n=1 Tax=Streptomyces rubrogriseus TaxID=194673 RepID=UPI0036FBE455